jgi:transposase
MKINKKNLLQTYIQTLGNKEAAKIFKCSAATCKSWRYGHRQPSIRQAHKIIRATKGRINYEVIYGSVFEVINN